MRIFGSISRLVSILFRKDGQDITVRPNQATTYTANRDAQLPPGDADAVLVGAASTQSLTNKTIVVASNIITTAASGNLVATELNAALAELQGDIDTRATASSVSDHLSDSSDAHDASAISFSATGNIVATDVQAAIAELDSEKLALAGGTMTGALTLSGLPSTALHAATKGYVDAAINGLSWKQAVRLASTANVVLASALEAGDTIDGEVLVTGDRVLLKDQTNTTENGIYVVKASGAPDRSTDMDETTPVNEINGAACFVTDGTQRGIGFVMAGSPVSTLGTDALVFVQFSAVGAYTAGTGINSTQLAAGEIKADPNNGLAVTAEGSDYITIADATISYAARKATASSIADLASLQTAYNAGQTIAAATSTPVRITQSNNGYALEVENSGTGFAPVHVVNTVAAKPAVYIQDTASGGSSSGMQLASTAGDGISISVSASKTAVVVDSGASGTILSASDQATGTFRLKLPASFAAAPNAWVLPSANATAGQALIDAAGNGVLSWGAVGSTAQAFTWTDGSATKVCTHTFGTDDVLVELYDSTSKETVYADFVDRTGTNEVTITRSEATVGSDWRVVIRN